MEHSRPAPGPDHRPDPPAQQTPAQQTPAQQTPAQQTPGQRLPGGFINQVVRIGDAVHRPRSTNAPFVHRLLAHLQRHAWPGAPRLLGLDEDGREVLTFIDGRVPWQRDQAPPVPSEQGLVELARLVRQLHDLTAGTDLAGDQEVVCHNDLSPKNTVYRDVDGRLSPVAFIDWDLAAPGRRVHDVAHVCWQFLDLGPARPDATAAARLVRVVADGYGLTDRADLIEAILWWQDRCWRGIQAGADAGDPAKVRLRDLGAVDSVSAAHRWTVQHRQTLHTALVGPAP